jgi:hypothetical protein
VIHTSGTTHRGTRYDDYNDLPGHTPRRRGTAANRWRRRALAYIGGADRVMISKAVMQGTRCANVVPWWVSYPLVSDGVDGEGKQVVVKSSSN